MNHSRTSLAALAVAMPASVRALNPKLFALVASTPLRRPRWLTDVEPLLTVAGAEVTLLLRRMVLPSAANLHETWAERHARVKWQRRVVRDALACRAPPCLGRARGSWTVTLTRAAPRALDDDNLASAFKAARDAIAAWLGVDDSPRSPIRWRYRAVKVLRGEEHLRMDLAPTARLLESA